VKMLLRYDRDGHFQEAQKLDKKKFRQPEGIAFSSSGDLFISTEGENEGRKKKRARVYHFARNGS
ncbi:MAG: hypothetical protein ABFS23_14420, partial [Pseudomonadota bacterium]